MIVDRLESDPRRRESIRVIIDGRPAWTVPADVIRQLGLTEGGVIPSGGVALLDAAAEEEGAVRAGLRLVERRAHSHFEIRRKLLHKGHSDDAVTAAMARLERLRLLDDESFAEQYVVARAGRGRGASRLKRDLASLGVDRSIVDRTVVALLSDPANDPWPRTLQMAERRASAMAGIPRAARQRRLAAFFMRRGFVDSRAREAVDRLVAT